MNFGYVARENLTTVAAYSLSVIIANAELSDSTTILSWMPRFDIRRGYIAPSGISMEETGGAVRHAVNSLHEISKRRRGRTRLNCNTETLIIPERYIGEELVAIPLFEPFGIRGPYYEEDSLRITPMNAAQTIRFMEGFTNRELVSRASRGFIQRELPGAYLSSLRVKK